MSMVRKVVLVNYDTRLQIFPLIFLNHVPTWDVSMFYHSQVEQTHRSRIEIKIPCHDIIVYVVIAYSHHMEYLLTLETFMTFRLWYGTLSRHCTIDFEGVTWSYYVFYKTII